MFQGRVYTYTNIDGNAKKTQKQFDSVQDFMNFLCSGKQHASRTQGDGHCCSSRGGDFYQKLSSVSEDLGIGLKEYKQTLESIEKENLEKRKEIHMLKSLLTTLKAYKKEFESLDKKELVTNVNADIKTVEAKLKSLGFENGCCQDETSSNISEETLSSEKTSRPKKTTKTSARASSSKKKS